MEPIHSNVRQAILDANPAAAPEDIDEYERLLAERFAVDPDAPSPAPLAMAVSPAESREARLAELHRKLFPGHRNYRG
jgi:hypothetical protein